jgi:hypothetical protein
VKNFSNEGRHKRVNVDAMTTSGDEWMSAVIVRKEINAFVIL